MFPWTQKNELLHSVMSLNMVGRRGLAYPEVPHDHNIWYDRYAALGGNFTNQAINSVLPLFCFYNTVLVCWNPVIESSWGV